jgi:hypothetical protein
VRCWRDRGRRARLSVAHGESAEFPRACGSEVQRLKTTVVGNYPKIPDPPAPGRWRTSVAKRQLGEITLADLRQVED